MNMNFLFRAAGSKPIRLWIPLQTPVYYFALNKRHTRGNRLMRQMREHGRACFRETEISREPGESASVFLRVWEEWTWCDECEAGEINSFASRSESNPLRVCFRLAERMLGKAEADAQGLHVHVRVIERKWRVYYNTNLHVCVCVCVCVNWISKWFVCLLCGTFITVRF